MDKSQIVLSALFTRAITTVDGGWRVSFDVGQSDSNNVAMLANFRDQLLHVVVMTEEQLKNHKLK